MLKVASPVVLLVTLVAASAACAPVQADSSAGQSALSLGLGGKDSLLGLQGFALLTVATTAPAFLVMVTSFTRIVVVLGFLRSAIGVPQLPPNQVMVGLAAFLTFFVMTPTWNAVNAAAVQPLVAGEINEGEAFDRAVPPLRTFMLKQTRDKDLALFVEMSKMERPETPEQLPLQVVIPAFVISELKTAFQMGFLLFVPFLVIDLVVSTTLMSMGMLMVPPSLIALPFKVMLFVLADGWHLTVRSIVASFA